MRNFTYCMDMYTSFHLPNSANFMIPYYSHICFVRISFCAFYICKLTVLDIAILIYSNKLNHCFLACLLPMELTLIISINVPDTVTFS